jgi:hypothetical protein
VKHIQLIATDDEDQSEIHHIYKLDTDCTWGDILECVDAWLRGMSYVPPSYNLTYLTEDGNPTSFDQPTDD